MVSIAVLLLCLKGAGVWVVYSVGWGHSSVHSFTIVETSDDQYMRPFVSMKRVSHSDLP